eukprot:TRINITY_DN12274_c0_g1_i11.p2 TRINITY_DN12274_c0_g1~~TRINITY_DN12274_c0_g1_i11.p2  ORF type:complete len:136 (+),score=14.91 TRINITY_DN12274_c0_g1_i11:1496-1903(+)
MAVNGTACPRVAFARGAASQSDVGLNEAAMMITFDSHLVALGELWEVGKSRSDTDHYNCKTPSSTWSFKSAGKVGAIPEQRERIASSWPHTQWLHCQVAVNATCISARSIQQTNYAKIKAHRMLTSSTSSPARSS